MCTHAVYFIQAPGNKGWNFTKCFSHLVFNLCVRIFITDGHSQFYHLRPFTKSRRKVCCKRWLAQLSVLLGPFSITMDKIRHFAANEWELLIGTSIVKTFYKDVNWDRANVFH